VENRGLTEQQLASEGTVKFVKLEVCEFGCQTKLHVINLKADEVLKLTEMKRYF
jgi:hypothetical protein